MKKIIALFLSLGLVISFCGCSQKDTESKKHNQNQDIASEKYGTISVTSSILEQSEKQISGYDVKVLYDETSKNRLLEDQIHQTVVDFMIALSKQDMDKIKVLSTNNFFNDILNHHSEAIEGIIGFDFSAIIQISSIYQTPEKYITYIIIESVTRNYECELEIVVNDNNVLVNNMMY